MRVRVLPNPVGAQFIAPTADLAFVGVPLSR